MITKLTKQQEEKIPKFINKWIKLASEPINRIGAKEICKEIFGDKFIVFGESLENTINLIKIMIKGKKREYDSQLHSQLHSQLLSQLDSQLYSQLYSQLRSQLYSQLHSQLHSQLYSQLYSQLDSQLDSQLYSQLNLQLNSQLDLQLRSQLYSQLDSQNIKYSSYISYYLYDWAGYYDYGKYIGIKFDEEKLNKYFKILFNIPIIVFVGNVIFICEKPQTHWKDKRLHSVTNPAIEWKDGTGIYLLHGIKFEKSEWEDIISGKLSIKEILMWTNTEKQRAAMSTISTDRFLRELNPKEINRNDRGDILYEVEGILPKPVRIAKYYDWSTKRVYVKFVRPDFNTIDEVLAQKHKVAIEMWLNNTIHA
mgnify:CR=1 FL=1